MTNTTRAWLIAALTHAPLPAMPDTNALVQLAENEGVLLLLEHQLLTHPEQQTLSDSFKSALLEASRPVLFDQMQMLAEQRRVVEVLQNANIDFLVMKGGALGHWLYEKPQLRIVTDLDILLPNETSVRELQQVLSSIGYQAGISAGEFVSHEHPYRKIGGPYGTYTIDAHWRLFNGALLQDRFAYSELKNQSIALEQINGALGLGMLHALFNACGHQALNLSFTKTKGLQNAYCLRWLWDIHLLAGRLDATQWQAVLALADEKQMSAVIHHSLQNVQSVLGSEIPSHVLEGLAHQASGEQQSIAWFNWWPRYQWQVFLASSPHWHGRLQWLGERIWPNPEAVRQRYGSDDPVWKFMLKRIGFGIKRLFGV